MSFWQHKTLFDMSDEEWESLCDGCGKCCMHKLSDVEADELWYTNLACKLFDDDSCRCTDYANRQAIVDDCIKIEPGDAQALSWLPATCAYRLLAEGESLPDWHPLISGTPQSVIEAGHSMRGRSVPEGTASIEELEAHIVDWIE